MAIAALVLISVLFEVDEILALFAGGILGRLWLYYRSDPAKKSRAKKMNALFAPLLGKVALSGGGLALIGGVTLTGLFLSFLKIGAVMYGSGYVLIALLQDQLVKGAGWLTQKHLIDAIALGRFTPGPVLSTAAFIGYQIHGLSGAIAATVAIFLPSFVFVAIVNPFVPKLRRSQLFSAFLDAVNASSVALIAAVAVQFAITPLNNRLAVVIFGAASLLAFKWKVNSAWLVAGGGIVGLATAMIR